VFTLPTHSLNKVFLRRCFKSPFAHFSTFLEIFRLIANDRRFPIKSGMTISVFYQIAAPLERFGQLRSHAAASRSQNQVNLILQHSICTHLARLSHVKSTSCFDVYDVSGYGSQMQKQVFAHSRLAHFCRGIRLLLNLAHYGNGNSL